MDQPRGREGGGAEFVASDLGGFQRGGRHDQTPVVHVQDVARSSQGRGLPRTSGTFDHHQLSRPGHGRDGALLGGIEPGVDQVSFDGQDVLGGPGPDVARDVCTV